MGVKMLSVTSLLGLLLLMGEGFAQPDPNAVGPDETKPPKVRSRQLGPLPEAKKTHSPLSRRMSRLRNRR